MLVNSAFYRDFVHFVRTIYDTYSSVMFNITIKALLTLSVPFILRRSNPYQTQWASSTLSRYNTLGVTYEATVRIKLNMIRIALYGLILWLKKCPDNREASNQNSLYKTYVNNEIKCYFIEINMIECLFMSQCCYCDVMSADVTVDERTKYLFY